MTTTGEPTPLLVPEKPKGVHGRPRSVPHVPGWKACQCAECRAEEYQKLAAWRRKRNKRLRKAKKEQEAAAARN